MLIPHRPTGDPTASPDVAIFRVDAREIADPPTAEEFGRQLDRLVEQDGHRNILLDLHRVHHISSSAFAALLNLAKKTDALGGRVHIFGLDHNLRIGADIMSLGRFIGLYDDEASALGAFR